MPDTGSPYQRMRVALARWAELSDPEWRALAALFRIRSIPPKQYILHPGDTRHELLFVSSGLLRIYYVSRSGEESNKAFVAEDMFGGPLATALLRLPSRYGIQALEPTTLLAASYTAYFELLDANPALDRLGRKTVEWVLAQRERREQSLLQQTAKERYLDFLQEHRGLLGRVPQYHIASYLGITEVSLSRLRRLVSHKTPPSAALNKS